MSYADERNLMARPGGMLLAGGAHVLLAVAALHLAGVEVVPTAPVTPIAVIETKPDEPKPRLETPPEAVLDDFDVRPVAPKVDVERPLPRELPPIEAVTFDDPPALPPLPKIVPAEPLPPKARPVDPVLVGASLDQRYADRFQPEYPSASRRLEEEGLVVVAVVIDPDGRVADARVARSSGHERLDRAAVAQALRKWRFVPAKRDGMPVTGQAQIPVRFELQGG